MGWMHLTNTEGRKVYGAASESGCPREEGYKENRHGHVTGQGGDKENSHGQVGDLRTARKDLDLSWNCANYSVR